MHVYVAKDITGDDLTLIMLRRLLSSKASKPCHVGIHWKALTEYYQMSTHVAGVQSFSVFFNHFVLAKLATRSIRVTRLVVNIPSIIWSIHNYT